MEWSPAAQALALMALPTLGHKGRTERLRREGKLAATFESFYNESEKKRLGLRSLLPECEVLVTRAKEAGLNVLALDDPAYPTVLRKAGESPPLVLFVQGELPAQLLEPEAGRVAAVAVVGTRSATRVGLDEAVEIGRYLAAAGVVVVSGLALGVDGAAHRGALSASAHGDGAAPTVAVLGGAHDRLHPKVHDGLAEKIVAGGGALLSEYPPGVRPNRGSFLARNRIIAWLSRAVVVVEAGERSGAISTATYASDAGITVLTVPTRPSDRRRAGNLKLLREGATPLIDVSDLADALTGQEAVQRALKAQLAPNIETARSPAVAIRSGPTTKSVPPSSTGGEVPSTLNMTQEVRGAVTGALEREIMAALHENGDVSFDGLLTTMAHTSTAPQPSAAQLAGALVRLEVGGAVRRGEDGRFSATGPLFAAGTVTVK